MKPFTPPQGVVQLTLDKNTNQIATPACPDDYTTAFIEGTQPTQTCEQTAHGNVFQRIFGMEPHPTPTPPASNTVGNTTAPAPAQPAATQNAGQVGEPEKKKKGFWSRVFGGSKDDNKDDNKGIKPAATPTSGKDRPH